jgi:serine/threonine protein kinase
LGQRTIAGNSVLATHQVTGKDDVKLGILLLASASKVLHDIMRLGRTGGGGKQDETITTDTLEKRRVLGAGTFGTVWLTRHTSTNLAYALKVQYKHDLIKYGQAKGVIREKNVMERMYHPFVMSIVNSQQDETCLYMVMDLMQGGELGSVMSNNKRNYLTEDDARFYAAGMLEGLVRLPV